MSGYLRINDLGGSLLQEWSGARLETPEAPVEVGGKLRQVRTLYPGAAEASVQTLGPEENDIVLTGQWKDRHIGTSGAAMSLMSDIEWLRHQGKPLMLHFEGIERRVLLTEAVFGIHSEGRIDYRIILQVLAPDMTTTPPVLPVRPEEKLEWEQALAFWASYRDELDSDVALGLQEHSDGLELVDALNDAAGYVQGKLDDIEGSIDTVLAAGESVATAAGRIVSAISGIRSRVNRTVNRIDRLGASFTGVTDDAIGVFDFRAWRSSVRHEARSTQAALTPVEQHYGAVAEPEPQAVVIARDGDTLQRFSVRYFGTADRWRDIADANDLETTTLVAGQELILPSEEPS